MRNRRLTMVTIIVAAMAVLAYAGADDFVPGAITGRLTDAANGAPIVAAWVAIAENNIGVETDSLGEFTIDNVAPGTYTLIITHPDYGTIQGLPGLSVKVKAGSTATTELSCRSIHRQEEDRKEYSSNVQTLHDLFDKTTDRIDVEEQLQSEEKRRGGRIAAPSISIPEVISSGAGSLAEISIHKCPPYPGPPPCEWDEGGLPPFDMFFRDYGTNGFVPTREDRFSTFAVDVDDASYALTRRYLEEGHLPPPSAIRLEEFVNHFDYSYNPPSDSKFRIFTELTDAPFGRDKTIFKVAIKGREVSHQQRKPLNLTFVVDVSGSMGYDNRMKLVKESLRMLVRQLDHNDRVGLVAYESTARELLEPISAKRNRQIFRAIDCLRPGGSTNAEAGLDLGYRMANRQFVNGHNNVVVLLSDGVANVGRTGPNEIMRRITRFARQGLILCTFGVGMGNYNDVLLEQLAQKGNGRYAYINNLTEARRQFVDELVSNLQVLARDVKVQVEFNPKVVKAYRLLGYENRDVPDHRFRDNRQDGGETGVGHEVTALYELELAGRRGHGRVATVYVRWKDSEGTEVAEVSREANLNNRRVSFDRSRAEFRLAVVAAKFAEILKGTTYAGDINCNELIKLARCIQREMPGEQIDELIDLIRRAGDLSGYHTGVRSWDDDDYVNNYRR